MGVVIHLTDNYSGDKEISSECIPDILRIASIRHLQNEPELLVFPHSFAEQKDGIADMSILTLKATSYEGGKCVSTICTGNLMGFVGVNDTSVSIHSRFTQKKGNDIVDESSQDYFLYYMLQKVLSINVFNLEHSSNRDDKIMDFLLFLFPMMLKKAMAQGLYKEYKKKQYDDDRLKGTIDVSRFIRNDIPFRGTISYTTREYSYDNTLIQLIRHTIEYIKFHHFGASILNSDYETLECVRQIVDITPTYCLRDRLRILNANRRPKVHPYYTEYRTLQKLCVHILRHDALKYGKEKDKIYGVLFDGAWLWEEYLNTILKDIDFTHAENKIKERGFRMFHDGNENEVVCRNNRKLYPDFYKKNFILDAKYKHLNSGVGREDLYQVVTYMYCSCAKHGGYIYPDEGNGVYRKHILAGYNGSIHLLPFKVPQNSEKHEDFVKQIQEVEEAIEKKIVEIDRQC